MAVKYRLSKKAVADLRDIWLYSFETWGQAQADSYYSKLLDSIEALADGLRKGRAVPEREHYLKAISGAHLIFYLNTAENIEVIRILHQSMDMGRHVDESADPV